MSGEGADYGIADVWGPPLGRFFQLPQFGVSIGNRHSGMPGALLAVQELPTVRRHLRTNLLPVDGILMENDQPLQPNRSPVNTSPWLVNQWIVAGIVSAASRFIPIPFVDDLVREQCSRFVASRTLASNRSDLSLEDLKPYYAGGGSFLAGRIRALAKAPLKLLLFPVRKVVAIATSVHGVPLEIMRMVLLGRTLARYLHNEELKDAATARRMRLAFDKSFAGMDFRVIRAAMSDALSSVSGWKAAAVVSAKRTAETKKPLDDNLAAEPTVDSGARKVREVLDRPETLALFAEFDRRFDETLHRYH